ncbi:MAG: GNAT family N-acetyltransferase [Clostridiales bacterium]|nr:GNAT family N-acetyltransferase [Clostridiales bacterium]
MNLDGIQILPAVKPDLEEILALQRAAYQSEAEIVGDPNIQPMVQSLESLREEYGQCTMLKAVADGRIIGSVRARVQSDGVHIGKLMVHPGWQNRGLGARLLAAAEALYPGRRYLLFTSGKSARNVYFYQKHGYRIVRSSNDSPEAFVFLEK